MSNECPPISDLLSFEARAAQHALGCERCRAILELSPDRALGLPPVPTESPRFQNARIPKRGPLPAHHLGEVVVLRGPNDGALLLGALIASSADSLEVVPLSTEVLAAAEWDLFLGVEEGPLGYEAIAEVWNHGSVSPTQISESLGALSERASEQLVELYDAVYRSEVPAGAPTGPPLLSEADPRSLFQQAEAERARLYWSGTTESDTKSPEAGLGIWLGEWMEGVGNDASGLATEAGWMQGDLERLLAEQMEPKAPAYAPQRIGELLSHTDIEPEDARVRLLVTLGADTASAEPTGDWADFSGGVKRRASTGVELGLSTGGRSEREAIEAYVAAVVDALEELRD